MVKQMATRHGVKVRAKDPCAYCGEPLAMSGGLLSLVKGVEAETGWDGERWRPYHHICWRQLRYEERVAARSCAMR